MRNITTWSWPVRILIFLAINSFNVFIAIVAISYLQPDFSKGFLIGKSGLFDHLWFPAGLYVHASSAPIALLLVSLLVLFPLEHFATLHRNTGKFVLSLVLLAVVPSGWILSYFAMGGVLGKLIFFSLSSYTAFIVVQGYLSARKKDFHRHQFYMIELLALLASAVLLRFILFFFHFSLDWHGDTAYNTAALLSWIPSVVLIRLYQKVKYQH